MWKSVFPKKEPQFRKEKVRSNRYGIVIISARRWHKWILDLYAYNYVDVVFLMIWKMLSKKIKNTAAFIFFFFFKERASSYIFQTKKASLYHKSHMNHFHLSVPIHDSPLKILQSLTFFFIYSIPREELFFTILPNFFQYLLKFSQLLLKFSLRF